MSQLILKETEYITVAIDPVSQIVVAKWSGFLKLSESVDGCRFLSDYFRQNLTTHHLVIHRDLKVLSTEVQQFLLLDWLPEIASIGVLKMGFVVADDVFAEVSLRNVIEGVSGTQLAIKLFSSEADCRSWLVR